MRVVISVIVALILTFGFLAIVMSPNSTKTGHAAGDVIKIVVAAEPIEYGLKLSEKNLSSCQWIKSEKLDGYFTDAKDLVDRITKTTIPKGIPIVQEMLLPDGAPSFFGKDGKGAMLIEVGHKGASKIFPPGCRVNVIGVYRGNGRAMTSQIILRNVEVLPNLVSNEKRSLASNSVFLAVSPKEAEKLALVSKQGTIKLMVCNPNQPEHASESNSVETLTDLLPRPTSTDSSATLAQMGKNHSKVRSRVNLNDDKPPQLLPRGPSPESLFAEAETHFSAFINSGKSDNAERQKAIEKFEEIYIKHPKSKLAPLAKEKADALKIEISIAARIKSFRKKMSEIRKAADVGQFELAMHKCRSARREFKDLAHPSLADELPSGSLDKRLPPGMEDSDKDEDSNVKAETVIAAEEKRIKKLERDAARLSRLIEAYLQRGEERKAKSYYQQLKRLYPQSSFIKPQWSETFNSHLIQSESSNNNRKSKTRTETNLSDKRLAPEVITISSDQ